MLPDLTELAKEWRWLIDTDQLIPVAMSPFGDLVLKDATGSLRLLDVNQGEIVSSDHGGDDLAVMFPFSFDDQLARIYRESGLHLGEGQCYGYKIQTVTGGTFNSSNVYVASAREYVSFLANFHWQIKDIPDGAKVKIVVTNQKVIQ